MTVTRHQDAGAYRAVLVFLARQWRRRLCLTVGVVAAITGSTLADVFLPLYAGRLVDALSGSDRVAARSDALVAFAAMAALGLVTLALRHLAWSLVVPLSLETMRAVAHAGFHRVQRLSTDWHANSFSGSTVRKISRGMWALEGLNDTLLLELLPAFVVLLGTMLLLGHQWPVMGLVIGLGTLVYLGIVLVLATRVIAPAAQVSNVWDSRVGARAASGWPAKARASREGG